MKKVIVLFLITLILTPSFIFLDAVDLGDMTTYLQRSAGGDGAGYDIGDTTTVESVIGGTIKIALSFLGVIFLLLVIYGGFMWMTARGNEQQVEDARKIIGRATIGLLVIMIAHAITWFIVSQIGETTGYGI